MWRNALTIAITITTLLLCLPESEARAHATTGKALSASPTAAHLAGKAKKKAKKSKKPKKPKRGTASVAKANKKAKKPKKKKKHGG